jgi:hypothetical protein
LRSRGKLIKAFQETAAVVPHDSAEYEDEAPLTELECLRMEARAMSVLDAIEWCVDHGDPFDRVVSLTIFAAYTGIPAEFVLAAQKDWRANKH